jgi:hypothetical protein
MHIIRNKFCFQLLVLDSSDSEQLFIQRIADLGLFIIIKLPQSKQWKIDPSSIMSRFIVLISCIKT